MPLFAADIQPFDWQRILLSDNAPPVFLLEIAFRCVVTYLMVLGVLRLSGRRGVRQLSIFELSIILALGSAAGDAMFYDDVPLLHVLVVFVVVGGLYRLFNLLTERYPAFSDWLEGAPVLLIEDGELKYDTLQKQNLTQKELFGELRQYQVEHLGQVRRAYIEPTGEVSIYFFDDADVRPGLPIWPERKLDKRHRPEQAGPHACACCGHVQDLPKGTPAHCANCRHNQWIPAADSCRVT